MDVSEQRVGWFEMFEGAIAECSVGGVLAAFKQFSGEKRKTRLSAAHLPDQPFLFFAFNRTLARPRNVARIAVDFDWAWIGLFTDPTLVELNST